MKNEAKARASVAGFIPTPVSVTVTPTRSRAESYAVASVSVPPPGIACVHRKTDRNAREVRSVHHHVGQSGRELPDDCDPIGDLAFQQRSQILQDFIETQESWTIRSSSRQTA